MGSTLGLAAAAGTVATASGQTGNTELVLPPAPVGAVLPVEVLVVDTPYPEDFAAAARAHFVERTRFAGQVVFRRASTTAILERLEVERRSGETRADVWWGGRAMAFVEAASMGMLAAYPVPWEAALGPESNVGAPAWHGCHLLAFAPLFGGDFEGNAPDLAGLLEPRYRRRVVLFDPEVSDWSIAGFGVLLHALARRADPEGETIEEGVLALQGMELNVKAVASDFGEFASLARDEGAIGIAEVSAFERVAVDVREGLRLGRFSSGTPVLAEGIAVVLGAPHPVRAAAFVDAVCSPEFQSLAAARFGRIPARTDVSRKGLPEWVAAATERSTPADAIAIASLERPGLEAWTRSIRGTRENLEKWLLLDDVLTVVFTGVVFGGAWLVYRRTKREGEAGTGAGEEEEESA